MHAAPKSPTRRWPLPGRAALPHALPAVLVRTLCLLVAAYALAGYTLMPLGALVHPQMQAAFRAQAPALVYLHVFGAAVALLLGPWQFSAALRARRPRLHRGLGRLYLGLGVGVGGLSGLALALGAHGGPWARAGFATLALLWLASGLRALLCIRAGDVAGHRRWMLRNFALTLAAVTLRLGLPAAVMGGVPLDSAYAAIAWLCWLPNLALAEALLTRDRRRSAGPAPRPART